MAMIGWADEHMWQATEAQRLFSGLGLVIKDGEK